MRVRLTFLALALGAPLLAAEPKPAGQPAHWAFRPPSRPALPAVHDAMWVRTPVDAFILARLERAGLRPAAPADRRTLLRRVTFDLTGLPPTPAEVDAFLQDTRPDAYVRVVDRLLASPHHGERWAQHWLDVVRYAESNGYEADAERPHAYRYRDWVVRAFNEDRPFDRFVTEQLAGDLLASRLRLSVHPAQSGVNAKPQAAPDADLLVAAGFNRCGPVHQVSGNLDPVVGRNEVLTEMTTAVGAAFLGLTVACARCHNHKFDPLSQADYYGLQAFFAAAQPKDVDLATPAEREAYDRRRRDLDARLAPLRQQLNQLETPYRERLVQAKKDRLETPYRTALDTDPKKRTSRQRELAAQAQVLIKVTWDEVVAALSPADRDRRARLREQVHALEAQKPPPPARAWTVVDSGPRTAHVLQRGDPHKPGREVAPAFPPILGTAVDAPRAEPRDRLALARWLTRPDHPLTARVIVNRLWQHHFGRGLVATPNDFGRHGSPPSHPELLDWLARELVEHGWSLKHLHRLMVLSSTYQQSSRIADCGLRIADSSSNPQSPPAEGRTSTRRNLQWGDPDNRLLARMNRRRLEGEALRDSALAVAGTLNPVLGGPPVRVPLEPEVYELIFTEGEPDGLWPVTPDPRQHQRRSLYLYNKRNVRLPFFEAFDQPDTLTSCPVRPVSTFAPQALILLNGPFLNEQARAFAARLLLTSSPHETAWIERAYRLALARPPRPEEMRTALDFLHGQSALLRERLRMRLPVAVPEQLPEGIDPALAAALADFCLAMFNRNEFLYLD